MHKLLEWKAKANNKPLVLKGARQVGKTTVAKQLGKEYEVFVHLNLEKEKDAQYFKTTDDVKVIWQKILLDQNIQANASTLLFIDEIQEVPEAISILRYFYEDLAEVDVLAAGSLLEFALAEVPSFPVGRVQQIMLHPMDFEEFLEALGEDNALEYYRNKPLDPIAHDKLVALFNEYMLVGGMPEVVATYVDNDRLLTPLQEVYSAIWDNYVSDIEKYGANSSERRILRHIIATAPQIRDRITFAGFGNSAYKSREVSEAFRKLDKAGLILLIYPTNSVISPIQLNYRRKPKIQFLDTGLLNYASGLQGEMLGIQDMNSLYKGYITNHMMIQELIATSDRFGYLPAFWTRENASANAEVDLVIPTRNVLIPIEVKSGKSGRLRSLHEFMDRCPHTTAVRLLANTYSEEKIKTMRGKEYTLVNLPYFAVSKIGSIELNIKVSQ